ncbi:dihydrofolate reductase family protein [Kangiella shandongensis]|uniref:dihydrofolate reductase family protein n=1 Tax=Kangiella shandongensis TaxID=2763258 RepID=UPI001CBC826E|nr:dihydrofolate reductase family protein [Kangiella shandongensis]
MAHVIHSINVTAGGLCHHLDSVVDDAHHQYALNLTQSADALLLGKNTFNLFMEFWPNAIHNPDLPDNTVALAQAFDRIPKLIVSRKAINLNWSNTYQISGPGLTQLRNRLEKITGTVVIFGSPSLASCLLKEGLINEIQILAQPLIGAKGPRAFSGLKEQVKLELLDTSPMPSGSILLQYQVL